MHYILTGFSHSAGYRVFAFDGVASDGARTAYSIRADLALARRYGIRMQELPLLCRGILERRGAGDSQRTLTFTEDDMAVHATRIVAALEASKQKSARRPFTAAAAESV